MKFVGDQQPSLRNMIHQSEPEAFVPTLTDTSTYTHTPTPAEKQKRHLAKDTRQKIGTLTQELICSKVNATSCVV